MKKTLLRLWAGLMFTIGFLAFYAYFNYHAPLSTLGLAFLASTASGALLSVSSHD